MELEGLLKFIKLTHDFQKVERALFVKDSKRMENDVEHSYQLAMVAWYAVSSFKLDLNIDKVIKYALLHDLVEVYAGDVYAFDSHSEARVKKSENEHKALLRLEKEFVEFPDMIKIIKDYESRDDEESKFIYALDKIIPPMNIYLDGGRSWQELGHNVELIKDYSADKVTAHLEVEKYYHQLMTLLEKEKHLFDKK